MICTNMHKSFLCFKYLDPTLAWSSCFPDFAGIVSQFYIHLHQLQAPCFGCSPSEQHWNLAKSVELLSAPSTGAGRASPPRRSHCRRQKMDKDLLRWSWASHKLQTTWVFDGSPIRLTTSKCMSSLVDGETLMETSGQNHQVDQPSIGGLSQQRVEEGSKFHGWDISVGTCWYKIRPDMMDMCLQGLSRDNTWAGGISSMYCIVFQCARGNHGGSKPIVWLCASISIHLKEPFRNNQCN